MEVDSSNYYQEILRRLVVERSVALLDVVQEMGEQLTDLNLETRTGAVEKLSRIVCLLPLDFLNAEELSCLIDFFSARFLDHHSLIPLVLQALKGISQQKNLIPVDALAVADSIVNNQHFQVQSLRQPERLCAFQTLTNMFSYHDLAKISREQDPENGTKSNSLLFGFIQSIDGEKDPRNLLLVFDLATLIAATFELGQLREDFFDVISCYFPIDFNPPSSDKQSPSFDITPDDLRSKLRNFFASNSSFSPQSIPLIVEKLSSSLPNSRLEAIEALRECSCTYPATCFRNFVISIWDSLQSELFNPLSGSSLRQGENCTFAKCLSALVKRFAEDDLVYQDFFRVASTQIEVEFVTKGNHRLLRQTANIISAFLRGLVQVQDEEQKKATSLINRYIAKFSELLLRCDSATDRQGRLLLVQSIETVLATELLNKLLIIEDKIADDLLSLLLGTATTAALLEPQTATTTATGSSTSFETTTSSLRSVAYLAKWANVASLRTRALDVVFELAIKSTQEIGRHCVGCIYDLLTRLEPDSSSDCRFVELALTRLNSESESSYSVLFDVIVAVCCASSSKITPCPLERFATRFSELHDPKFEQRFTAMVTILEHHGLENVIFVSELLRPVLKERLMSKQIESETVRRLIALLVEPQYLLQLHCEQIISASDVVNILSLCPSEMSPKAENCLMIQVATTAFKDLPSENDDEFCLSLSGFLVKCFSVGQIETFYIENKEWIDLHVEGLVVIFHSLTVTGSSKSSQAADSLLRLMSSKSDEQIALNVASMFGKMFAILPVGDNNKHHPRHLIERVSPLRRQALVARMAPYLAENVRLHRVDMIANLNLLADLTKLTPNSSSNKALLEPIWPSIVEQLNSFPSDRLVQVLSLLSENLKSILDSSEAIRLVDILLTTMSKHLTIVVDEDEVGTNGEGKRQQQSEIQVRIAVVNLLARLSQFSTSYSLLLGPLQRRVVRALKPCLADHKRLVRSAAANAVNKWCCS